LWWRSCDEINEENTRTVVKDSEFQNECMELVESIQNGSMNNLQLSPEINSEAEDSNIPIESTNEKYDNFELDKQPLAKRPIQFELLVKINSF